MHSREDFEKYIDQEAPKYGLSASEVKRVVDCETAGTWDPGIQSGYYQNGVREDSWGLAQIFLPAHPEVEWEQAIDPKWSLDFMLMEFSKGNQEMWSCY